MNRRGIPVYELSDYRGTEKSPGGISVWRVEDSIAQRPNRLHPHYHPFYQVFLTSGKGSVMLDFIEYPLTDPTLVFASPNHVHVLKPAPALHGPFVSFTQDFFDHTTPPPSKLLEFPFFFSADLPPLLPLQARDFRMFQNAFAELQQEYAAGLPGAADLLRAYLWIIFTRAARLYSTAHRLKEPSRPAQLVHRFRIAVETRFHEITALPRYAALLKVTANHLNDTVREQTGQSAGEIVRQRQLLEAKRLLLHSELSISEIGYRLNFKDPSYFSRFFRRYTSQSPADFRTEIREKYHDSAP